MSFWYPIPHSNAIGEGLMREAGAFLVLSPGNMFKARCFSIANIGKIDFKLGH